MLPNNLLASQRIAFTITWEE